MEDFEAAVAEGDLEGVREMIGWGVFGREVLEEALESALVGGRVEMVRA
jgi:hypothetical protein